MRTHALLVLATILVASSATAQTSSLLASVDALKKHITGAKRLTASEIDGHKKTIDANRTLFASSQATVTAVFDLVATYDRVNGPLWIARGQFDRRKVTNDIHWTIYNVMQHTVDQVYTAANIAKYESVLKGFKFGCSSHFPGAVAPPATPNTHTATIDASYPDTWGRQVMHADRPARKPTGTYLAPGSIVTVTVPSGLVGKGYQIRVGAHSWDMTKRPWVRRLDRCTCVYDITSTTTKVASPLGGGIYIEVPFQANAGVVNVRITNAVRSPFFSAKRFHTTTLNEWRNVERKHKAPWADFQSEKFMMQVPTDWIYNLSDPVTLMKDWDKAMDATNDLMGFPRIRGKEALYDQVDVIFRASVYAPGYPSVNVSYDPKRSYGGNHGHFLLRGPQKAAFYEFHEMGHGYLFQKFPGEVESNVNLLHVVVWHQKFGYGLDHAFRASMGFGNAFRTLENTAVAWMMCENFKERRPMAAGEKAYQLKGHAKFVDIARLFGWKGLGDYWKSFNADYENKATIKKDIDNLIFRLCNHVGVDLLPLLHFWGLHPVGVDPLRNRLKAANLLPSTAILDTLRRYESRVPVDLQAYRNWAQAWWGRIPRSTGYWTERDHAKLWNSYDKAYAERIRANVRHVLGLYFDHLKASTSDVGTSCRTGGPLPRMASSTPVIGQDVMLAVTNVPPAAPGVFLLGNAHTGIPIGNGCSLYVDATRPVVPIFGTGTSYGLLQSPLFRIGSSVPPGLTLGAQGGFRDTATAPLGMALSHGMELRVGY